ncbi:glycoside hydrolase family 31 protein [Streptococcus cuniculi]|uniref:Alpha-xylosidase n=1 Tax=Streptococcus cuniculi TaxID=1432788 RepID=A0A4Y9JAF8_9STRE|nr:TIM-barrel domain-containing protein [Streptococcus cuniculi]MBF0777999.1 glycoside hydrolase family 31 protein [Streptococcus cuniculi]TFU98010.1 alpha-xylosidase [Streptococcus cuniculi]
MNRVFLGESYRITVLNHQLVRLEYSEEGYFEDRQTKIVQNRDFECEPFDVIDEEGRLEIITPFFHLHYTKEAFHANSLFIDVRNNYTIYGNRWYFGNHYDTLKGTARTLDEMDGATELEEGIISKQGFAVLDDSDSFILDEEKGLIERPAREIDLYFFAHGRDYFAALKDFYQLTGPTPLLPRYALGNWWSRYWPYSEEEYLGLMERFEMEKVPLSVSVIDMDWHRVDDVPERFGSGWTGYSWNRKLFPDPERFLKKLHDKNLKVTLNVHPAAGIRAFEDSYPQVAERMGLNVEIEEPALFDIANPLFREAYFKDVHHELEKQGVDFWWIDWQQGTEGKIDPLWLLNYYHYLDSAKKGENDVILSRYAGPGSHRFPIGFSGDTFITWESLAFQPYFTSTASNIGYTWWSHDIGGHMHGYHEEELALRWLQFGVFSPINRLHSSNSPFASKEPWGYSPEICQAMKEMMYLRHRLLPYLYTMNVATHEAGKPLMTPMYYHYPLEEESYHVPNQYFFGSELMVAPITQRVDSTYKVGEVTVWLPEGVWYDWFTDTVYKGGTRLDIYRTKAAIPVFAKERAIVPLDQTPDMTGVALPEVIEWHIFPGKNNAFCLVEDENGQRAQTTLAVDWNLGTVSLEVVDEVGLLPKNRQYVLKIHTYATDPIVLENCTREVPLPLTEKASTISFREKVRACLQRAEIEYDVKHDLLARLEACQTMKKVLPILQDCDSVLRGQLMEIIYTSDDAFTD